MLAKRVLLPVAPYHDATKIPDDLQIDPNSFISGLTDSLNLTNSAILVNLIKVMFHIRKPLLRSICILHVAQ